MRTGNGRRSNDRASRVANVKHVRVKLDIAAAMLVRAGDVVGFHWVLNDPLPLPHAL